MSEDRSTRRRPAALLLLSAVGAVTAACLYTGLPVVAPALAPGRFPSRSVIMAATRTATSGVPDTAAAQGAGPGSAGGAQRSRFDGVSRGGTWHTVRPAFGLQPLGRPAVPAFELRPAGGVSAATAAGQDRAPAGGEGTQANRRSEAVPVAAGAAMTVASWYGPGFNGHLTANGEVYDQEGMTAAHRTLPFGSLVRVTNLASGQQVIVRINDRGPFVAGRGIDLSHGAAVALGMEQQGLARVALEVLGRAH